ncbi:acyl-CoA dehydrogenase family protein [Rhodococcus rhodochrous]|uniref:Acyl-CoA dehydrogenase n=1 Tax=Rhodococcus rhodochrous KG-21 TaxID=1441923 RepID=A0A0M8PTE1_RHORH|nr:acyl-CoA dehydrogenase family protein [Rhodococcus rhodochrous]KOS58198.1 acyl-CoA dehydrogenase [Rhodococcus rhodochrous KG-21]
MGTDNHQPTRDEFVDQARRFLDGVVAARSGRDTVRTAETPDEQAGRIALFSGSSPEEVQAAVDYQRALYDAGYGWISGPVEDGGAGYPVSYEKAFAALERSFAIPSKAPLSVSLGMVAPTIAQFGSAATKQRWMRALRRADAIGCQLFSEPAAGSDLAAVQTRAVRDGDGWILNGQKVWTSGAHYSDVGIALTRTSNGPRHRNLTVFAVDMHAPGVEVRPLRQMTGGADFNEVFLVDVRVPDEHRLGEVDGGWTVAMAMLMHERGAIGGSSSGGSGLFRMDDLAQWLQNIDRADDEAVAQAFAEVYCGVTAAKAMRARADANLKANGVPGPEMSLGKLALTANLSKLSDLVSLALGPRLLADNGEHRTFAWSEFVLGVPGMRIGGGTDEIHRDTIANRVLGLPKEATARA